MKNNMFKGIIIDFGNGSNNEEVRTYIRVLASGNGNIKVGADYGIDLPFIEVRDMMLGEMVYISLKHKVRFPFRCLQGGKL